ncbi:MAG: phosphate ABC transporter substrate-binding protein, partial [Bacteroidaceae bacterium]
IVAYDYHHKTKRPYAGMAVMPLDINGNGKIDAEENFYGNTMQLMVAIAKGKYPSPPARNLFLVSNGKPTKPEVIAFIKYILSDGQKYANITGYIGLSKKTINEQLAKLKK